jgi:Tfp pilus assembly protein PilN
MIMIKVNLLGVAAPKPKAKAAEPAKKSATQVWVFLGALVVSFGIVGGMYLIWSGSIAGLEVELKKQKAVQTRLVGVRLENAKYEQERALLEQRVKAVQMLQASRVGPTEFMNALGNVVSKTPTDLFFFSVVHQGDRVVIQGQSGSANSVAALLALLKTSGYFDDVQLRQLYEDDKESLVSYKFNLDCSYKSPSVAGSVTSAAAGGGTAAPPQRTGM